MTRHTLFAAVTAALTLSACVTVPDSHPLTGTQWQLVAIDTSGSTTTLIPSMQARHTVSFLDGGAVQVQLDCNRGRATWTAGQPSNGAGAISIGPVASTRMACQQPSFGDQLASGLGAAERFTTTIDRRQLVLETADLRFTFAAIE